MARASDIKTGLVRVAFLKDLFDARAQEDGGIKKYGCTLLVPKTDSETIALLQKNFIEACVNAGWGDEAKVLEMFKMGLIKSPVLDGDGPQGVNKKKQERYEGFAGHYFIRTSSGLDYPPAVFDEKVNKIASYDANRFKAGDYGYAVIGAYTWDNPKNGKGATFGISGLQKIKDGAAFATGGGGVDADKFFKPEAVQTGDVPDTAKTGAGASSMFG